jgi:hypothetical protein
VKRWLFIDTAARRGYRNHAKAVSALKSTVFGDISRTRASRAATPLTGNAQLPLF